METAEPFNCGLRIADCGLKQHEIRNAMKAFYDGQAERVVDEDTKRLMEYRRLVTKSFISGKHNIILEIGPGDGALICDLVEEGHRGIVLDISENRLRKYADNAQRLNIRQMLGNAEEGIELEDESLDVVLCCEVLEHIPCYKKVLKESYRVLRPGGQIILTVPYIEHLKVVLCPDCHRKFEINGHLHTFDEDTLKKDLKESGFVLEGMHIGHTFLTRELWKRRKRSWGLGFFRWMDKLTYKKLRVSDTWILVKGVRCTHDSF